jgi:putative transposase
MNLSDACQALGVSRSGYHDHLLKSQRPRRVQDALLASKVRTAFDASRQTYGSPRLMHTLRAEGLHHGKNRIARLMRQEQLRVRQKRRFVPRTTRADKTAPIAPNHLLTLPAPSRPNQIWVTDITYLPTREGWLYLAAEMDLCSRRILGWSTHTTLATELPAQALQRALQTTATDGASILSQGLLHHSDRGCQYTSAEFRQNLKLHGITASMSRKANCYDNAAMESFWATLKTECFATTIPDTRAQARTMVFDYIETFYNPVRLHSSLGFQSPLAFEQSLKNN